MLKKLVQGAAGASLLAASALAFAGEPVVLSEAQMDTVSAGNTPTLPTLSQLGSLGAVSWAMSKVSVGPAGTLVIDANFDGRVGLFRNGTIFDINIRFVRPS